jgi:hypothetical protein
MSQMIANIFEQYFALAMSAHQLSQNRNAGDATKLVQIRREHAQVTLMMHRLVDEAIQNISPGANEIEILAEYRSRISNEAAILSQHRVKWTAPTMQRDREGYQLDLSNLIRIFEENHRWRQSAFLPILRHKPPQ